jgi:hypothetical protein
LTSYGRRRASQTNVSSHPSGEVAPTHQPIFANHKSRWARIAGIHAAHVAVIVLLFVAFLHIAGMRHH